MALNFVLFDCSGRRNAATRCASHVCDALAIARLADMAARPPPSLMDGGATPRPTRPCASSYGSPSPAVLSSCARAFDLPSLDGPGTGAGAPARANLSASLAILRLSRARRCERVSASSPDGAAPQLLEHGRDYLPVSTESVRKGVEGVLGFHCIAPRKRSGACESVHLELERRIWTGSSVGRAMD